MSFSKKNSKSLSNGDVTDHKKQCKEDIRAQACPDPDNCDEHSSANKYSVLGNEPNCDWGRPSAMVVTAEMCFYCFNVLQAHLFQTPSSLRPKFTNEHFPLFVTWKIGKEKRLRGCVGTFTAHSLHGNLRDFALSSALRDSRFKPITKAEFDQLHVSVSLLLNFEPCDGYKDWEVGVHGVRVEFRDEKHSKHSATYLPEVAAEQEWDHVETIDSLINKSGFRGPITEQLRLSIRVTRYRSEKMSVSYQDYLDSMENATENDVPRHF